MTLSLDQTALAMAEAAAVEGRDLNLALALRRHLAAHFPGVNNTTVWSDPSLSARTAVYATAR